MSPTRGQAADLIHSTEQKTVITLMDSYRHLEYIHPEHQFYAPGYQHVLYLGQLALGQHKLDVHQPYLAKYCRNHEGEYV